MRKGTKNLIIAVAAVFAAAVLACAAALALYPSGSSARYVDSEVYEGTEIYEATSGAHDHEHDGWTCLNDVVDVYGRCDITSSGSYYLSDDLFFPSVDDPNLPPFYIWEGGIEVDLCLNGHVLSCDGATCINISSEAQVSATDSSVLNLYDCGGDMEKHYYRLREDGVSYTFFEIDENGDYARDSGGNRVTVKEEGSAGYVRGGLITGGTSNLYNNDSFGGGINVQNRGTLNMYGGTIAGNVSVTSGGGVCVSGGTFNMYGGTISGNRSETEGMEDKYNVHNDGGGGVCVHPTFYTINQNIFFRMYGGEIRNNYCESCGGGVEVNCLSDNNKEVSSSVTFEMYGGIIAGNAAEYGGGVSVYGRAYDNNDTSSSAFEMYGGSISDNVAESGGGGVYMETESVLFEMSGGSITCNVQTVAGEDRGAGGVDYEYDDTVCLSGTAYIYGNFCEGKKSDVGIADGHYITLSDSLTDGAKIGVILYDHTQITTNYITGAEAYFWSDEGSYGVRVDDTGVYLELYEL